MTLTGSARKPGWTLCAATLLALLGSALPALGQQLEPRAFAPNPVGAHFVLGSMVHTEGDVLLDASSPIEDFRINLNVYAAGYGQTFALGDRVASFAIVAPYADGRASGTLNGEPRSVSRAGPGDLILRITASLMPGSALDPATFARHTPDRTLGASLVIVAPTGEYFSDKLINIGTNRWAFKPELGGARQFGRWGVDGSIGAWFYTVNDDYFGGSRRKQDPIGAVQGHVSYTFRPRLWLAADVTWYTGGRTQIDGVSQGDRQENSRAGLTLSVPVSTRQSVKLSWSTGTSTRIGGDFDSVSLAWQYLWFD
jgi:hypothetical protein